MSQLFLLSPDKLAELLVIGRSYIGPPKLNDAFWFPSADPWKPFTNEPARETAPAEGAILRDALARILDSPHTFSSWGNQA